MENNMKMSKASSTESPTECLNLSVWNSIQEGYNSLDYTSGLS